MDRCGVRFSQNIEDNIRNCIGHPIVIKGFLDSRDLSYIRDKKNECEKVVKNSDIVNLKYKKEGQLESWILNKLSRYLVNTRRHGGSYVITKEPFHVHTDSGKKDEMEGSYFPYKNVLIPLTDSENSKPLYTIFFKQRSLFEASHYWNGVNEDVTEPFYNNIITNYQGLISHTGKKFDISLHKEHLSHIPIERLEGLSIEKLVYWNIGDVILFDCSQLHASNNIKLFSGTKESLSLFTSKRCL